MAATLFCSQETEIARPKKRVQHQKQTSDHPHPPPEGREVCHRLYSSAFWENRFNCIGPTPRLHYRYKPNTLYFIGNTHMGAGPGYPRFQNEIDLTCYVYGPSSGLLPSLIWASENWQLRSSFDQFVAKPGPRICDVVVTLHGPARSQLEDLLGLLLPKYRISADSSSACCESSIRAIHK